MAKSLLIKDTTVSERAQIVREALGCDSDCEGVDLSDIRKDGMPVTSKQVYTTICRFPKMFTKEAGRIMLMI